LAEESLGLLSRPQYLTSSLHPNLKKQRNGPRWLDKLNFDMGPDLELDYGIQAYSDRSRVSLPRTSNSFYMVRSGSSKLKPAKSLSWRSHASLYTTWYYSMRDTALLKTRILLRSLSLCISVQPASATASCNGPQFYDNSTTGNRSRRRFRI
jgi:hypothetical protein